VLTLKTSIDELVVILLGVRFDVGGNVSVLAGYVFLLMRPVFLVVISVDEYGN
jgi:hypothetical protein